MTCVSAPGTPSIHRVDEVIERAENPREDHQDAHLDEAMAAVVDRYGSESIRTVIQRVRVDDYPFRTATADLDVDNIDGVRIGTTAVRVLEELHAQGND